MKNYKVYIKTYTKIPTLLLVLIIPFALLGAILGVKRVITGNYLFYARQNLLHVVRERYQRVPSIHYLFKRPLPDISKDLTILNDKGIVHISGLLNEFELKRLKNDFNTFIEIIQKNQTLFHDSAGFTEEYYDSNQKAFATNNPFKYSDQLVNFCCQKKLLDVVNFYLRRTGYVHQAVGLRLLPGVKTGNGSFQWHHDAWGKRLNVMILLTDIGEGDQYMTYVEQSHKIRHTYEKFVHSRLTLDYCRQQMDDDIKIYKAQGKAGDVFIFDPNGAHSGNRTNGNVRDVFIVSYTSDTSYIWGMDLPAASSKVALDDPSNPFKRIVEYKQNNPSEGLIPRYKSWSESLSHIGSWI